MSPEDAENEPQANGSAEQSDRENNSVADKLSKELSNWRKQRTGARSHRASDGPSPSFKSDAARTIKVRGHETLVIRKPKVVVKPPLATDNSDS
jgi:hypothetical protein